MLLGGVLALSAWTSACVFRVRTECGRAKQTMGDMRTVATAIESYQIDHDEYPRINDIGVLVSMLEPTYVKSLPVTDGWGTPFIVRSDGRDYVIQSAGPDRHRMRVGADRQRVVALRCSGWFPHWSVAEDRPIAW